MITMTMMMTMTMTKTIMMMMMMMMMAIALIIRFLGNSQKTVENLKMQYCQYKIFLSSTFYNIDNNNNNNDSNNFICFSDSF